MSSGRQEIDPKFLDGERHVPQRLRRIEQKEYASLPRQLCDFIDRLDRPSDIRDVGKHDKLGVGSDRRADTVRIDPSGRIAGDSSDTNEPRSSSQRSGRKTELCSAVDVTTWSSPRRMPWIARLRASVQLNVKIT